MVDTLEVPHGALEVPHGAAFGESATSASCHGAASSSPVDPVSIISTTTDQHLGTGWCVSVSQPPAEVCLTDLAWDYPGV